jgi:hypothetical protein
MKIDARDFTGWVAENIEQLSRECVPFWHPLGFVSAVVAKVDGSHTLRLHYWPKGQRRTKNPDWPIHTHSYSLSSLVLAGSVEDLQYELEAGSQYSVYEVRYFEGDSEIVRTDRTVSIVKATAHVHLSGIQYRVERGVFHQSRVALEDSAVTLVALSENTSSPPLVLGATGERRYPYDRTRFDPDTFWAAARTALGI